MLDTAETRKRRGLRRKGEAPPFLAESLSKIPAKFFWNKQYITLDNSYTLLYTVCKEEG